MIDVTIDAKMAHHINSDNLDFVHKSFEFNIIKSIQDSQNKLGLN